MLTFDHVSKNFTKNSSALADVTFTINDGEFVFIVGPSGAGKSTLLALITCQLVPTYGMLKLDDIEYAQLAKKDIPFLRRKIGTIFQDYKLLFDRTVKENICLPLEIEGMKAKDTEIQVKQVLQEVGLSGKEKLFPRELAGGEIQRVAIARAIIMNPAILLADEPTADLDPANAQVIVTLLEKLNTEHKTTILMATHNMEIVEKLKKRVLRLEDGRLVQDSGATTPVPAPTPGKSKDKNETPEAKPTKTMEEKANDK